MNWTEVKRNVAGAYDRDRQAEVIVEALCLSTSPRDFVRLIRGAMDMLDDIHRITYGDEGDNT